MSLGKNTASGSGDRAAQRHARVDAVLTSLVGGGGDDLSRPCRIAVTADDDRAPAQVGTAPHLDCGEELIEVDVKDPARHRGVSVPTICVMTEMRRCRWCRRPLPEQRGRGRPREFCSQRCRQWDWVARQRAGELELSEGELVIARTALDELHDQLYVLACAVEDTDSDLAALDGAPSATELRRMLDWLLDAPGRWRAAKFSAPSAPPRVSS